MSSKVLIPWLSLLAAVAQAQDATANTTLVPLSRTAATTVEEASPSRNITLNWESLNSTQMVTVALAMNYSTIVLEELAAVSFVDCSETSVAITFNETDEFTSAQTNWAALEDSFVLITNHVGDCDAEFERGFFLADTESMVFHESNLTAVVSAEKTNVTQTARKLSSQSSLSPVTMLERTTNMSSGYRDRLPQRRGHQHRYRSGQACS